MLLPHSYWLRAPLTGSVQPLAGAPRVSAAESQQLSVPPALDNAAAIEHDDLIGVTHGRGPVRGDGGAPAGEYVQRRVHGAHAS